MAKRLLGVGGDHCTFRHEIRKDFTDRRTQVRDGFPYRRDDVIGAQIGGCGQRECVFKILLNVIVVVADCPFGIGKRNQRKGNGKNGDQECIPDGNRHDASDQHQ